MESFMKIFSFLLTSSLLVSCQTSQDSTLLGVGIGSLVGAGFGAAAGAPKGNERNGAMTGAAVGAALGGLMGFLDHKERTKDKLKKENFGYKPGSKEPFLAEPEVERVWVPAKINGDKYVDGHWMYVIRRPSMWRKDD
jgi:hypothetical protein